jgi:hypothetical protein
MHMYLNSLQVTVQIMRRGARQTKLTDTKLTDTSDQQVSTKAQGRRAGRRNVDARMTWMWVEMKGPSEARGGGRRGRSGAAAGGVDWWC